MKYFSNILLLLLIVLGVLWMNGAANAEILYETGSLRGFLGGSCPNCAYDNWISHISEGIALPGYNNYGPVELDPQTNGFGRYQLIPNSASGDSIITVWSSIFTYLFNGDTSAVESRLIASGLDSIYQLVILSDTSRVYYILRETLNMAYYDSQMTPEDTTDDVRGSFDLGWGVYVFSPSATQPEVNIQAPHCEDDFISTFIAIEVFELYDAGFLMIAGAGREVLWTGQGEFNNTKSLSDPSRIYQTVFHTAHRAFVDHYPADFTLQLHSYDSELHPGMKSLVVSAGADDPFPNEPVLDRCVYDDMISLTPFIAVPANTCGNHPDVTISAYYRLYYEGGYAYQGNVPVIPTTNDLFGYGQNQQVLYSHQGHRRYLDSENFIHIEMDEFPDPILDTITVFYRTNLPGAVTFDNYVHAIDYYRPAFQALGFAMSGTPMSQLVTASPYPLVYPEVMVYDSDTLFAYFHNISLTQNLSVEDVYTDGVVFSVAWAPLGTILYPGSQCSVQVVFHPQDAGDFQRILTFSTDVGCSHLELEGTGLGGVGELDPPLVDFGPVSFNRRQASTVHLRNTGNFPMNLVSLIDSPPHFFFTNFPEIPIQPNQQITLELLFIPWGIGIFCDTMYVVTDTYSSDTLSLMVQGEGAVLAEIFFDDFSQDLGWTGYGEAGEWTRGRPQGGPGDDNYGGPDPLLDHSSSADNFAIGNDLTVTDGDYEAGLGQTFWITSPAIDCSIYQNVFLKYWHWLGVERNQYDHASVEVYDGTIWVRKWENSNTTLDENNWSESVFDVSHQAGGNAQFRIRFGIGPTDGSWQYCGWNIDDLVVIGIVSPSPTITDLTLALAQGNRSVRISWSSVSEANFYRVYRGDSLNFEVGPESMIIEIAPPDTTYIDSGILNLTPHAFYRVTFDY